MTTMLIRDTARRGAVALAATAAVGATALAGSGQADALPLPGAPAPHPAAAVHLADWYGTAWAVTLTTPDNGGFVLTHDKGRSPVVLEQRSVKYRKKVGTPWKRLAIARPGSGPVWGQWTRLQGFDGKQFRLCRLAPTGKDCTSYSNIIVP
ncbi:hypothetical protein [Gordonia crocea]|uniref:Secreted protein n=1 Tax=Gordonia crocea TaxID=589162 RepID=A0A7M3SUD5_9ACTN|nr:hypothetical protein [Gordonia crocea]GED96259.1 hypothetical protein nbrc107697_02980 [Gordonia crocea]